MTVKDCEFFQKHDPGIGMSLIEPGGFHSDKFSVDMKANICHGYHLEAYAGSHVESPAGIPFWQDGQVICVHCAKDTPYENLLVKDIG